MRVAPPAHRGILLDRRCDKLQQRAWPDTASFVEVRRGITMFFAMTYVIAAKVCFPVLDRADGIVDFHSGGDRRGVCGGPSRGQRAILDRGLQGLSIRYELPSRRPNRLLIAMKSSSRHGSSHGNTGSHLTDRTPPISPTQ